MLYIIFKESVHNSDPDVGNVILLALYVGLQLKRGRNTKILSGIHISVEYCSNGYFDTRRVPEMEQEAWCFYGIQVT